MTSKKNLINLSNIQNEPKEKDIAGTNDSNLNESKLTTTKKTSQENIPAEIKSFRMISKIEPQQRKGRYNIYINEEFAFGVDEEVLLLFELKKGLHVTKELQEQIEKEESFNKAYQKVLNYLSYSLRTEKQIEDYLIKNELEHFTNRIIEKLKEIKLIDDLIYAQSYVRSMANINQKGPSNIIQDLKIRGVSENNIYDALEEYPENQQLENAIALASKKWDQTRNRSTFEGIQKVKQFIVNKGYSFEMADQAVSSIDTEREIEEEYQSLEKQAEKAHKRYARKYTGYELTQRLRAFLFSKGYPKALINRYIEGRESE